MSTLYFTEEQQPSVADGLASGRYIKCIVKKMQPCLENIVLWIKFAGLKKTEFMVITCPNPEFVRQHIDFFKEYIIDTQELAYGGLFSYIRDTTQPIDLIYGLCAHSSAEIVDIFAGPHSVNYPLPE